MRRPVWVRFTANDGHSIGLDSLGRGFEVRQGELARLPDPPPVSVETGSETRRSRRRRGAGSKPKP